MGHESSDSFAGFVKFIRKARQIHSTTFKTLTLFKEFLSYNVHNKELRFVSSLKYKEILTLDRCINETDTENKNPSSKLR